MARLFPGKMGAGGKLTDGKGVASGGDGKILSSAPSGGVANKLGSAPNGVTRKPDTPRYVLPVSYITANLSFKSRNFPNTDVRNYSIDLR